MRLELVNGWMDRWIDGRVSMGMDGWSTMRLDGVDIDDEGLSIG